ncbi:hypothetical protein ADU90_07825 (plasmid) [Clostridium botulinum]|uniref:Uncharacterized protein n=6 Tax=Clostridium botulinum TaxID=1491 RepID=A0A0A0HVY4_CLOBO|nr:hypothetical protein [Clostridium botulinum]KGM93319.1 hypothetical protein Z955_15185 [Clostridium botulinum C/D str. DC5]KOC45486.1 hypothetical protein ADU88_13665 [Clostridium botulinum]KOC56159.1 hypothetical protein ADU89_03730 [Clostridium botulinum]KOC56596.1 hypothetical protein ADU90_07825 [Clostridium botulinum]MCD3234801.1 hypothetical protein [Clostridium botulinum D/C]
MGQYIGGTIKSIVTDTIVKRDEPYTYSFSISKIKESNAVKQFNINDFKEFDNGYESLWDVNMDNWIGIPTDIKEEEKDNIKENLLQISGEYYNPIKYIVFFNDIKLKESNILTYEDITDEVTIDSGYFNNVVDGFVKIQLMDTSENNKIIKDFKQRLTLINTKPYVLVGDIINNRLNITVNDKEKDRVKINIKLNDNTILPSNGQEFSDYLQVPYFYNQVLDSEKINVNPNDFNTSNNTIIITVVDEYGDVSEPLIKHFVGQFNGLMFLDENLNYLCDDSNNYNDDKNIVKDLYLGKVQAGQKSKKVIAYIKNNSDNILTNIKLKLDKNYIKNGTDIRIGRYITDSFSKMSDIIDLTDMVLMPNQTIPFYVQGDVDILSEGGGYFYVDVIADTQ